MKKRFFVVIDLDTAEDYEKIDLGNWLHACLYGSELFLDLVVYDSVEDILLDIKEGNLEKEK